MNSNIVSQEWARRPIDERFLSVAELKEAVKSRKAQSWTATPQCKEMRVIPADEGLAVQLYDPTRGAMQELYPTNWAFGQLAGYAQAPANYLRTLPKELAAINMQWGLEKNAVRDTGLALAQTNGNQYLRAITSTSYGRIWDLQVVEAVERANPDNRWKIPSATYGDKDPKRATTLYASDRDVFMFLVDPENPIEVNGEKLFRGFITWNSEVGAAVFGLTTFLYRTVCDNRIIWGMTEVNELRIRHTGGAPDRFAYEGAKYLKAYANEKADKIVETVKAAQEAKIPKREDDTVEEWLQSRGFTKAQAKASVETAKAEEGESRSIWNIINGVTAYARSIGNTDNRVELEKKAGAMLDLVARD